MSAIDHHAGKRPNHGTVLLHAAALIWLTSSSRVFADVRKAANKMAQKRQRIASNVKDSLQCSGSELCSV